MIRWLAWASMWAASILQPVSAEARPVQLVECRLSPRVTMRLLAESHGVEGRALLLAGPGDEAPVTAFADMPSTSFVGTVRLARCVRGVLLYALDHGPPYRKGVAMRVAPATGRIQRIDFAEKQLPRFLFVDAERMRLVFPHRDGEHPGRYTLYGTDATDAVGIDRLPDRRGAVVHVIR